MLVSESSGRRNQLADLTADLRASRDKPAERRHCLANQAGALDNCYYSNPI
jgi:hypothetical protein